MSGFESTTSKSGLDRVLGLNSNRITGLGSGITWPLQHFNMDKNQVLLKKHEDKEHFFEVGFIFYFLKKYLYFFMQFLIFWYWFRYLAIRLFAFRTFGVLLNIQKFFQLFYIIFWITVNVKFLINYLICYTRKLTVKVIYPRDIYNNKILNILDILKALKLYVLQ